MKEKSRSGDAGLAVSELESPVTSAAAGSAAFAASTRPATPSNHRRPYRILLVDDHPVVRRGIRAILDSQPGLQVCGEAADGAEAMELVKKDKPDLVVLDLTMPKMNGLEVTAAVREQSPETTVLVLSMHFSEELAREALRCGALGNMLKSDADAELLAAVDHMRHHEPFFTAKLAVTMAENFVAGPAEGDPEGQSDSPLTDREIQVVQLLAEGKSNKEVAAALGVSTRTVESHRNHIMRKMSFTSFSDLIRFAVRNNLVAP
jgi:DNA-binding NarL/FixJ family response regulator